MSVNKCEKESIQDVSIVKVNTIFQIYFCMVKRFDNT